jgi:hypothetical protein
MPAEPSKGPSMKINSYEFLGVMVPGVVLTYGLSLLFPELGIIKAAGKVSFGDLGLLLVLAFVVGQLVQAGGNVVEAIWWAVGGWPSDWIRSKRRHLLAEKQYPLVYDKLKTVLKIEGVSDHKKVSVRDWHAITRQVYAAVANAGRSSRIDIFNGNYGMFRGVVAAVVILIAVGLISQKITNWKVYAGLVFMLILALARMHRFAVYYSRELFIQFIQLDEATPSAAPTATEDQSAPD